MHNDSVHIQHLNAQYRISRSKENPKDIRRRLDRMVNEVLARIWDERISRFGWEDDALYFIKEMEVNLTLDLSNDDDRALAGIWAGELQKGLHRTIHQSGSGITVFRNRADFLASFLSDLWQGRARECWYYKEFDHLYSFSFGQAATKILTEDGDIGRDALIELTRRGDLEVFLTALTDAEVETVVSCCLLPNGPEIVLTDSYRVWVEPLLDLLARGGFAPSPVLSRDIARLYLTLLCERPELGPDVNLARFLRDLLLVRQSIREHDHPKSFLSLIESEDIGEVLRQLSGAKAQQWLPILIREMGGTQVAALLRDLQVETPQSVLDRVSTSYGGIFLLIPAILEMKFLDFLNGCCYPEPAGISKAGLLLSIIALQCLGSRNVHKAREDKGIALFAGLQTVPNSEQIDRYARALTAEMHDDFRTSFRAYQREIADHPGVYFPPQISSPENPTPSEEWFALYRDVEPFLPDREWDSVLAAVSSTVLHRFAAKLGAFADSSPAYLCRNFLESRAEIEVSAEGITVHFLTCPLQMVLRMAGFDHGTWEVPWLENKTLECCFD